MRKELKCIITGHLLLALFLAYCSLDLLWLAVSDATQNALTEAELNDPTRTPVIPKIIHQTYKNESIPVIWQGSQQECKELHPDYEYILWTDEKSRDFIAEQYPWFLKTWDSYRYPIERADAIRYFALSHYGGVYIDLDDSCHRKLDPLLTVPAFARQTKPTGVSNDVMGSVPGHPFFEKVIHSLDKYNHNWLIPYVTIMISTGPLFLSVVLEKYKRENHVAADVVRVILPKDYKGHSTSFFSIVPGSSWHQADAKFITGLGRHIPLAVFAGFATAGIIFLIEWHFYQWCINTNFHSSYERVRSKFYRTGYRGRPRKDSNLPANILLKEEDIV